MGPEEKTSPLRRLTEAIGRRSVHEFMDFGRENGLSLTQLNTIQALRYRGPLTIGELGAYAPGGRSALTQFVDSLERAGLAIRVADKDDRRRTMVILSPEGERLAHEGSVRRTAWVDAAAEGLGSEALSLVEELARRIEALR